MFCRGWSAQVRSIYCDVLSENPCWLPTIPVREHEHEDFGSGNSSEAFV